MLGGQASRSNGTEYEDVSSETPVYGDIRQLASQRIPRPSYPGAYLASTEDDVRPNVPRQTFKASATYTVPALRKLRVGRPCAGKAKSASRTATTRSRRTPMPSWT